MNLIYSTYLIAIIPFAFIWLIFFLLRKDLRKEILIMSIGLGILSVATAYFWWTKDWWSPPTITNTAVGLEDFLVGFFSGGIIASSYEILFRKRLKSQKNADHHVGIMILLFLAALTMLLFWGLGFSSFWASTIAFIMAIFIILYERRDLLLCSLYSGVLMLAISFLFYGTVLIVSSDWMHMTYRFPLSGISFVTIPVEEFVFWFLAGVFWGPFYEYWRGKRLVNK